MTFLSQHLKNMVFKILPRGTYGVSLLMKETRTFRIRNLIFMEVYF